MPQTKGYDPVYGARPVKRAVQRELETGLAKSLLRGDFAEEDTVLVDAPGGTRADTLTFRCGRMSGSCLIPGPRTQHYGRTGAPQAFPGTACLTSTSPGSPHA